MDLSTLFLKFTVALAYSLPATVIMFGIAWFIFSKVTRRTHKTSFTILVLAASWFGAALVVFLFGEDIGIWLCLISFILPCAIGFGASKLAHPPSQNN